MIEQFEQLIAKEKKKELIAFLKELSNADKKKLTPTIKKLNRHYSEFKSNTLGQYRAVGSENQLRMLLISAFVCANKEEWSRLASPWMVKPELINEMIDWYCPTWFSDYINDLVKQDFLPNDINYAFLIDFEKRGYLQPSPELIARLIPPVIFEQKKGSRGWVYNPENLLVHSQTLKEHIWYLFDYETNLHYSDRWLFFEKDIKKDEVGWINLLVQYQKEGKIDRKRLLQSALLASNKNFNKVLSGWFCDLFVALQPTPEEMLVLEKELFSLLSASHSKPVNTALQCIKKIVPVKNFDAVGFIDNTPQLLTSDIKNIVVTTIGILEKLAKKNTALQLPICQALLQTFIHNNDELQLRAAKIITTYPKLLDEAFGDALQPYDTSLMASAKKLLAPLYATHITDDDLLEDTTEQAAEPLQEIPVLQSIDDFIFLTSQAFDNNEPWHMDTLPAAILQWWHALQGNTINKLEPALQRALKITRGGMGSGQGDLDHMMAIFFIDVCILLCRKHPNDATNLIALFKKFDTQEGNQTKSWLAIANNAVYMTNWDNHYHDPFYLPHKQLLLTTLEKIIQNETLPLLSTPTHQPCWIMPEVLVQRLAQYQKTNTTPFNLDIQIAVSRCALVDTKNAISLAEKELSGEYKNMLLFLFGHTTQPQAPFVNTAAWMCCSLALKEKKQYDAFAQFAYYKKPFECYTGNYSWNALVEEYNNKVYDYSTQQMVTKKAKQKILKIHIDKKASAESFGLKKFFNSILQKQKEEQALLYDFFDIKAQWLSIGADIPRLLLLSPNNPAPFLAEIINRCLKYPSFFSEEDKKAVTACLHTLHQTQDNFGDMVNLFLGMCMMASDKTVVNIAGEIWIKAVSSRQLDNATLGAIIGKIQSIEFAPLKRLTDLISNNLFKISNYHNTQLALLIENILVALPNTPMLNLKKLLELYAELIAQQGVVVSNEELRVKLRDWGKSASLSKLVSIIGQK